MLAGYLSRSAIDVIGIFSDHGKLAQAQDEFCTSIKNTCTPTQTTVPADI
jgi:hypothetical protein